MNDGQKIHILKAVKLVTAPLHLGMLGIETSSVHHNWVSQCNKWVMNIKCVGLEFCDKALYTIKNFGKVTTNHARLPRNYFN